MEYQFESIGPALRVVVLIFLFVFVLGLVAMLAGIAALPGWVARKRNHPQAAAVNIGGWFGLPTGVLWVLAMVWAYMKYPSTTINSSAGVSIDAQTLEAKVRRLEASIAKLEAQQPEQRK